ncbi:uncharacterized protein C8Q71DRAFT_83929 [Rhodofomes roseus]|uniref:Secreted protein n=1 Tax=Rhodofomes roseus TaxID=34475 RepID=A0ABQ8KD05_9APHY|nr:uncharacterized protein C8Q71DRAFT_83929 [Rhodofomes roseus]KAH9835540.1 hypothetical protein C8Q71DRAFT_83929 [Rhodofomes roseus]
MQVVLGTVRLGCCYFYSVATAASLCPGPIAPSPPLQQPIPQALVFAALRYVAYRTLAMAPIGLLLTSLHRCIPRDCWTISRDVFASPFTVARRQATALTHRCRIRAILHPERLVAAYKSTVHHHHWHPERSTLVLLPMILSST